ncbi:DUF4365 domain-containing protein [Rhodococcus erythropolis]
METEARGAFSNLIEPTGWVVRAVDGIDYGIDDEVEVFEDDHATGIKFYVQSRGTDGDKAMTMELKTRQQNYFRELDLPVLLARYHSPTKRTFVKWFHRFDPYPRKTSQTIHFNTDEELSPETVQHLATEIKYIRAWSRGPLNWPIALRIESEGERTPRDLELIIFELVGKRGLVRTEGPDVLSINPVLNVTLTSDALRVHAATKSHTSHGDPGWSDELDNREVAALIVFGVAIVLSNLGHGYRAGPLFEASLSAQLFHPDLIEMAATHLVSGGRADCALRIGESWLREATTSAMLLPSFLLLHNVCSRLQREGIEELRLAAALLERFGAAQLRWDEDIHASASLLMAARLRFSLSEWQAADELFRRASDLDSSIASSGAGCAEMAGAAYEAGDYPRAAEMYAVAIDLVPDDMRLLTRRADSLMRQGALSEANSQFEDYFARVVSPETIWFLKHSAVQYLIMSGIKDVDRDSEAARRILEDQGDSESRAETVERCLSAVRLDPMNAAAWGELGRLDAAAGRYRHAAAPLSIAALADRRSEPWAMALTAAFRADLLDLARFLAQVCLHDYFGDEFHLFLLSARDAGDDVDSIIAFTEVIDIEGGRMRRGDRQPIPTPADD